MIYDMDFSGTGDYEADCRKGRQMAIRFLVEDHAQVRLPHVVEAMERPLSGVAIAFLALIAERAS